MVQLEIDDQTGRVLEFAARMAQVTPAQLVARLVDQASLTAPAPALTPSASSRGRDGLIAVRADYEGFRTTGWFDPATSRIDITGGPLDGQSFKSPTGAARAVVGHYKPGVSPHRNGWSFWLLDDGSNQLLQSIRPRGGR
ncbi:hypothetical protein V3N99_21705 [Dermatophilaceae bacterium Soc4.6]